MNKKTLTRLVPCSEDELRRAREAGLIAEPIKRLRRGRPGSGGWDFDYPRITLRRMQVIRRRLVAVPSFTEAALELVLEALDPTEPDALRAALRFHFEQKAATYALRERQRNGATTPESERQRIERTLKHQRESGAYPEELAEAVRASVLSGQGLARPYGTVHGIEPMGMPSYAEVLRILEVVSPGILSEAAARTRQAIPGNQMWLFRQWSQGVPERDEMLRRALLAGHLCTQRHTLAQAARPWAIISLILQLNPSVIPESLLIFKARIWQSLEHYSQLAPAALRQGSELVQQIERGTGKTH